MPLIFVNPSDYDKFQQYDKVSFIGLRHIEPEKNLTVQLSHQDGSKDDIQVKHTLTKEQIQWFKAGSALNKISEDIKKAS